MRALSLFYSKGVRSGLARPVSGSAPGRLLPDHVASTSEIVIIRGRTTSARYSGSAAAERPSSAAPPFAETEQQVAGVTVVSPESLLQLLLAGTLTAPAPVSPLPLLSVSLSPSLPPSLPPSLLPSFPPPFPPPFCPSPASPRSRTSPRPSTPSSSSESVPPQPPSEACSHRPASPASPPAPPNPPCLHPGAAQVPL
jgi:hypothetical protein